MWASGCSIQLRLLERVLLMTLRVCCCTPAQISILTAASADLRSHCHAFHVDLVLPINRRALGSLFLTPYPIHRYSTEP